MSISKTIGGDRIGSGSKMTTSLHDYGMSSHNLSEAFISSMSPGVLVPFYCNVGLNGDVFDFDLDAMARTIPTKAPLFGSFKLQIDMFSCPIRLYQGLLHNNALNIGMKMSDVKFPTLSIRNSPNIPFANNSLVKYLGLSGLGSSSKVYDTRTFNAVPTLCYYDIFKNYYANKQEEKAFVVAPTESVSFEPNETKSYVYRRYLDTDGVEHEENFSWEFFRTIDYTIAQNSIETVLHINVSKEDLNGEFILDKIFFYIYGHGTDSDFRSLNDWRKEHDLMYELQYIFEIAVNNEEDGSQTAVVTFKHAVWSTDVADYESISLNFAFSNPYGYTDEISLIPFDLTNIDLMRDDLLKESILGSAYSINTRSILPYSTLFDYFEDNRSYNCFNMDGLCVKTYQSDLFNSFVQTEWITGTNGIANITAVDVSGGELKLDALNLAQKVYNMLNRIAVSGGTYNDWQEAVYSRRAVWHAETPIYIGGMSSEIVFEEIVSTARAGEGSDYEALGSLAGKGKLLGKKGGRIHLKVNEPTIIMGIVSITPRLCYTQGNMWYMTDLFSVDDLHKPALDGIGFQDLIGEQMAWFDTVLNNDGTLTRRSIGKVPAWINYMTAFDKAFGDFAQLDDKNFMVLSRNYERDSDNTIKDATTYIDPTKFNYPFAYTSLAAQNFWIQISTKCIARRVMSAKIIPTL